MDRSEGRVVIVTGGGVGLGLGIARAFIARGARAVLAGRRLEPLQAAAASLGPNALAVQGDVSSEPDVERLFHTAKAAFGRVDVLVNNAGFGVEKPADELTLGDWRSVIDTNLTGAFLCAREAIRTMKLQGGGRIINIGSISAHMPRPNGSAYAATKYALEGLTRAWSLECREHGIAVSILHPGGIQTSFQGGPAREPRNWSSMDVADVARVVVMMAELPADVALLNATLLPIGQPYLGRG